jgi:hypothetical protein
MNRLRLFQVYVQHIWHVIENSSLCTKYKFSVNPGFAKLIMSVLLIFCYNGSLVTTTESESYITTDGQPASLSWNKAPIWGLRPDLYFSESCGFVDLERPLWREAGSVVYNSCWPSPAKSFSGPSPVGLVAIFYCFRFETFLFVASCDSQGHGGGIRPRLHTGPLQLNPRFCL